MRKHNFSAGPALLPSSVFEKASKSVINYQESGLSILEISHRSKEFTQIINRAQDLVLEHLELNNQNYQALFLHGGASLQFLMVAYNLLQKEAAYLNTGVWSQKAIKEAKIFGKVTEIASSEDRNFNYIPKNYIIPETADYFHCTSNNTIYGTQIKNFPETKIPVVCDMSSDIFSRKLNFSKFDLIYAGVQKNMGPAGAALVVIKEDILGKVSREIPSMLNYQTHISKSSVYNTAPVFPIYTSMLTLEWLKEKGGVSEIEKINNRKAEKLYFEIDRNPLFEPYVKNKDDRSAMNITFNLKEERLKPLFGELAEQTGVVGINGHRSLGGYRASIYNALPLESVELLIEIMQELERKA